MKRRQFTPIALIFILAFALLLFYEPPTEYKEIAGYVQGTTYHISYQDRPGRNLQPRIEQLLHRFDMSLSTYEPESIISRINNNEENVRLDKYFKTVFNRSEEIYHLTSGAFDITIAPLVNAWGFGPEAALQIDSAIVDSLKTMVGMHNITLISGKIAKKHPEVKLDVNGIAQGYSVDIVAEFLERKGITNYLVEIGGEIIAKGVNKEGNAWRIGIDKPVDDNFLPGKNLQAILSISNKALATSGNYRKYYEKDGQKYVHSINPESGYPVKNRLLSTTVLARDCMTADAFATAFMVMGVEKSIMFLSNHKEIDAYLIYSDKDGNYVTFMTPGIKDNLVSVGL
jgi:thiamine biosynthesis lipoprotein